VTPPPPSSAAAARRPPAARTLVLALLYLLPLAVAALTPGSDLRGGPQGDVSLYWDKARSVLDGLVPYRDFPLEYPPLALVPMVVPYILWPFGQPSIELYPWLFAGEMAVLLLALGLVVRRIAERAGGPTRTVEVRLLVLAVGASLALTWRFDLFPALLAIVAVWAALEGRPVVGGAALGVGILAKLFPIVVAPAIAVAWLAPMDRARLSQFALALLIVLIGGMLPFVDLAGDAAFGWVGYQTERGLQIESVGGGLVLLSGLVTGEPIELLSPFSAWEVTGLPARTVLALTSAGLIMGFVALAALGWRRMRSDQARGGAVAPRTIVALATAAILVLIVTSKVFSIQYVVWLLPFAALLPRGQLWLAAAAVALTIPIHPALYEALVDQEALPILVLNLRNALLVALLVWVVKDLARPAGLEPTTFRSAT
jgi:hypothetical protein